MDKKYSNSRNSIFNINYHIVWVVKYRKPVLINEVELYLKQLLLKTIPENKEFSVKVCEVLPDHVHAFVSAPPKVAPGYIVKMLKGISGRLLFIKFPEIEKCLWKGKLWSPSYFVETIGSTSEEAVKLYIQNQKTKD
ncbi:MAG: IS200/IS605 family transposase [Candidatus Moranbacteria bacterium]|nr:IS200/IS605 family transposase [Candidatus Moranbacteria bacterium]